MSEPPKVENALQDSAGKGQGQQGISLNSFLASLAAAAVIFAVEFLLFVVIKNNQPRTYLVPEKERTKAPPSGLLSWIGPVFKTSNSDFIQKCGLDAYFFLRYLRTLLKIFIPLALVILPVLLPLNQVNGRGRDFNVTGLDQLAWGNVRPENTHRYWGHLVLAVAVVCYVLFVFYDELRGFIRLRQAYLTSPQHRLRASATTVLVTAIPRTWLTAEKLEALYDVFPGGIRNIWINRDYDKLSEKVERRKKLALALEGAETDLVRKAKKAHLKRLKKSGPSQTKDEKTERLKAEDRQAEEMAKTCGTSSGDPHQTHHTLHQKPQGDADAAQSGASGPRVPIPVVGQGIETVAQGFSALTGTVIGGLKAAGKGVDDRLNTTGGFVMDGDAYDAPGPATPSRGDPGYRVSDVTADDRNVHPAYRTRSDQSAVGASADARRPDPNLPAVTGNGPAGPGQTTARDVETVDNGATADGGESQQGWKFWKKGQTIKKKNYPGPKPPANSHPEDERPLSNLSPVSPGPPPPISKDEPGSDRDTQRSASLKDDDGTAYPKAFNKEYDEDRPGEPLWTKYLKASDRDTMRLPIFGWQWMPALPLLGKRVDTIYYCRREVARLNVEIERDQNRPEDFPLMNSAFIQFHNQIAAHMACQAVSHHVPKHMAPRIVEISPDDVIWSNMSIRWWERYVRTALVVAVVVSLIIGWAFPVTFTGFLSQLKYISGLAPWLNWIGRLPDWLLSLVQGILPQLMLALLLAVLPMVLRALAKVQGEQTGMGVELSVQNYYFAFLFVQIFLVVSISSGITSVIEQISRDVASAPGLLATNLPKASNYFFSYMILQAFSVSAGALVQIGSLLSWFLLAPILDNTARQKWTRQTQLPEMRWGTFFPVYTNLAAIGLIYSVVSPLILIFNIITFGLFWIVYRYNTLYVTKFRFDTGGLLFPKAINQLFTGLYFLEICLIGLFFLVRDERGRVTCTAQGVIMVVMLILTVLFQYLLNEAFGPLFRYLPISLEDDAAERDQDFAGKQLKRLNLTDEDEEGRDLQHVLEDRERREREEGHEAENIEMRQIELRKHGRLDPRQLIPGRKDARAERRPKDAGAPAKRPEAGMRGPHRDVESQQHNPIGAALFSGINDEIQDLSPEDRDGLIRRAFQHEALRAKRPVIWIPRDSLGVSDDEIMRTRRFSKNVWISNEFTGLDSKGRVVYKKSPPDFSEVDLIEL
ncbi:MAG: hypothetical protein M1832_001527 [Thelocarpon impressellum]|nr:MAG: hypothetical protein M1832_001527 [Thelocarpon impressellum]